MTDAHRRKKNPELIRSRLMENTIELARQQGLSNVGLDAVAKASDVTRGAVSHHFPTKKLLVDAVFEQMMTELETSIERKMAELPSGKGLFTRAYLEISFEAEDVEIDAVAIWASISDAELRQAWTTRFGVWLERFGPDENGPEYEAVRFAADGIWLGILAGIVPADRDALRAILVSILPS